MKKSSYLGLYASLLMVLIVLPFTFASGINLNNRSAVRIEGEKLNKIKLARQQNSFDIEMKALNNSNEDGKATFTASGTQTKVTIELDNAPGNVAQPVNIHSGSCPNPGDKKISLNDALNGRSETMINVSMDDLIKQLPMTVVVYKSTDEQSTYVSCGEIKKTSTQNDDGCFGLEQNKFRIVANRTGTTTMAMIMKTFEISSTSTSPDDIAGQVLSNLKTDRQTIGDSIQNQDDMMGTSTENEYFEQGTSTDSNNTSTPGQTGTSSPGMMYRDCIDREDFMKVMTKDLDGKTFVKFMMKFKINSTDKETVINEIVNRLNQLTVDQIKAAMTQKNK